MAHPIAAFAASHVMWAAKPVGLWDLDVWELNRFYQQNWWFTIFFVDFPMKHGDFS